jgi:hypothetical protein
MIESSKKVTESSQKLIFNLLIGCRKYEMLVLLIHFDVIQDNEEHVTELIEKGIKENEETLITLAIDMAHRVCKPNRMLELLIASQRVWEAKRYFK